MTHAVGTYLGGIRSVADLRERCRIDDETGCWHWGLAIVRGVPHVAFVDEDGRRRKGTGRALQLQRIERVPGVLPVRPPSTGRTTPLTYAASSDAM